MFTTSYRYQNNYHPLSCQMAWNLVQENECTFTNTESLSHIAFISQELLDSNN